MPEGDPPLSLRDLDAIGVGRLRDVGRKRATALTAMEINSVLDLLQHYPRRYIDRTNQARIADSSSRSSISPGRSRTCDQAVK